MIKVTHTLLYTSHPLKSLTGGSGGGGRRLGLHSVFVMSLSHSSGPRRLTADAGDSKRTMQ